MVILYIYFCFSPNGSCKHVATLLYYIESCEQSIKQSVTCVPQSWQNPRKVFRNSEFINNVKTLKTENHIHIKKGVLKSTRDLLTRGKQKH